MNLFKIAIDGPVASGKGTVSKLLAKKLEFVYIDGGAIYRAMTLYFLRNNITVDAFDEKYLEEIEVDFNENGETFLNSENVSHEIRSQEVGANVSQFAQILSIREFSNVVQRKIGDKYNVIVDGRDGGTVVFPNAQLKIYLDASVDERVRRRIEDFKKRGDQEVNEEKIREEIIDRDKRDKERNLKVAPDAIVLDNTSMNVDDQIEYIIKLVNERQN